MAAPGRNDASFRSLGVVPDAELLSIVEEELDLDNSDIEGNIDEDDEEPDMVPGPRQPNFGIIFDSDPDDTDEDPSYDPELTDNSDDSAVEENGVKNNSTQQKNKRKAVPSKRIPKVSKRKKNDGPAWQKKTFQPQSINIHQPSYPPEEFDLNWDDDKYVSQYIDDDILQLIVDKTNQTAIHLTGKTLNISLPELKVWIGINCVMSALQLPKIRMYWEKKYRIPVVANGMSRDRFFCIRKSIKVVYDNDISAEERQNDRIWKIRPLVNRVLAGCLRQHRDQKLCIDEMIIPFSGACGLKQYIPNKPNPLGLKVFVLAQPNGIICNFTIYQGRSTFPDQSSQGFSIGESAVLHLSQSLVPGHILYFDRYFTTVKLASELLSKGIRCTGTLMKNQIPKNTDLVDDKQFKKERRGYSNTVVREDSVMACTKWLDNKPVVLLSTNEGYEPEFEVKRWSKKERAYIQVKQPHVVNAYNKSMGGVDLADRMLSYCPARARTRKWTVRCILHMLDMAIANAWLQMRQFKKSNRVPAKEIPQLRSYKLSYGERLIERNSELDASSDSDSEQEDTFKDGRKNSIPSLDQRIKGAKHLPQIYGRGQQRCRNPKCSMKTTIYCVKCKVYLCLKKDKNCFLKFHQK